MPGNYGDDEGSSITPGNMHWRGSNIERCRSTCVRFPEALLVLIHLSFGLPAQGPEPLGTKSHNTDHARHATIQNGTVLLLTFYHKRQRRRTGRRAVCRFLAPSVGGMLVPYLAYVVPFISVLRPMQSQAHSLTSFLFSHDGTIT